MILLLILALPLFGSDFSYVYNRPDGKASISMGSLEEVLRLKKRFDGEFLWARVDGRNYLTRDAAVLNDVRVAFRPLEALNPHQRNLHAKMKPIERRHDRLEEEHDDLTDRDSDYGDLTAAEKARMEALEEELEKLRVELRVYEREERGLDRREQELEKVFDAEVERIIRRAIRLGVAQRLR